MKRRDFVSAGAVGLGVIGLSALPTAASASAVAAPEIAAPESLPAPASSAQRAATDRFAQLLSPIAVGASLADTCVVSTGVDERGTGVVRVRTATGREFRVDVCTRSEDSTVSSVASTDGYQVFVRNGGDGNKPTNEDVAHAALALAEVIANNERSVPAVGLVTKSEYWTQEFWLKPT